MVKEGVRQPDVFSGYVANLECWKCGEPYQVRWYDDGPENNRKCKCPIEDMSVGVFMYDPKSSPIRVLTEVVRAVN